MYRVSIEPGGAKLVYWDNQEGYPTPLEISKAAKKEFPNHKDKDLIVTPLQEKMVLMTKSSLFTF